MKVCDLIAALGACDPQAEVFLMSQPSWPFEYAVRGVVSRRAVCEEDGVEPPPGTDESDVFIVEGTQVRYGSKGAWTAR